MAIPLQAFSEAFSVAVSNVLSVFLSTQILKKLIYYRSATARNQILAKSFNCQSQILRLHYTFFFSKDGDFFIRLNLFTMAQFLLRCLKARNDFSTSFQCMPGEILIESIWYDPAVTEDSHPKCFSQKLIKMIYKYFKRLFQYFVDSKGKHRWHFH